MFCGVLSRSAALVGLAGGLLQQGQSLAHEPEALRSGFGFSQIRLLVTHKVVSHFQMREGDRGKMGKQADRCRFHPRLCKLLWLNQRCY